MEFRCRLKIILWEKNIKQGEFAKAVGISQAGISSLVNNKSLPTFENAYKICKELGMEVYEIWEEENEEL
ncbi:helix-turn-helix transcriptional regulator [Geomicrobium sediminis]|uniref:DNA-binding XRE family transcriptional regulator n=1 Tax=Geomicrobium sediminis TaxID=1347788 RepID=A0ABS2PEH2_9BACL|nr:helix-turn-helix transcriptional regulator [Geomicrobium sediminis]MBM7633810.1 DNA-binding XRE family transcriptional regulator [Geomicrobium sediminis]